MAELIKAGDIGRLKAATSVAVTDRIPIYQAGKLTTATPDLIAAGESAVVGPASATDNAIVRFDATTGKLVQNSAATIADTTGALTIPGTTNQITLGATNTTTISATAPAASRTYTLPDVLGAADFVMNAGAQTIAGVKTFSDNLTMGVAAKGLVLKQGANGKCGTFVCNGATPVTVNNSSVAITDTIIASLNTVGGTVGNRPSVKTITASTGFTIAGDASDTSTYNYVIISNAA